MLDYTSIYREVYSVIKKDNMPHEIAHNASLRISEAISDIYLFTKEYSGEALDIIKNQFGGFDLDDK